MKTKDMDIHEILKAVESGAMSADDAVTHLRLKPYEDIGYAKVDLHRKLRQGVAEVIYGESKTSEQIEGIVRSMAAAGQSCILITRLSADKRLYDVGVAGIHRLMDSREEIMKASVIIAIAGMEGALASVVGGMADCPVIAVPTSVGYGAAFDGLAALLSMLNSCASGVAVVNIDNGFGAGYLAHQINHMKKRD